MRIKLNGCKWNNIDLSAGLPEDIKARVEKAAQADVVPSVEVSSRVPIYNNLYIAQHNFVDTQPVAVPFSPNLSDILDPVPDADEPFPLLPGQPISHPPEALGEIATHAHVTGANLADLITAATGGGDGDLWTATTGVSSGYMTSFTRDERIYRSIGTTEHVSGSIMRWSGWGITYYTGLFRPALFSQYSPLSLLQQPVVFHENIFVIDYAKTEIVFEIMSNGEVFLLHGEIK